MRLGNISCKIFLLLSITRYRDYVNKNVQIFISLKFQQKRNPWMYFLAVSGKQKNSLSSNLEKYLLWILLFVYKHKIIAHRLNWVYANLELSSNKNELPSSLSESSVIRILMLEMTCTNYRSRKTRYKVTYPTYTNYRKETNI